MAAPYVSEAKKQATLNKYRNYGNMPDFLQLEAFSKQGTAIANLSPTWANGKKTLVPVDANILSKGDTFEHLGMLRVA